MNRSFFGAPCAERDEAQASCAEVALQHLQAQDEAAAPLQIVEPPDRIVYERFNVTNPTQMDAIMKNFLNKEGARVQITATSTVQITASNSRTAHEDVHVMKHVLSFISRAYELLKPVVKSAFNEARAFAAPRMKAMFADCYRPSDAEDREDSPIDDASGEASASSHQQSH